MDKKIPQKVDQGRCKLEWYLFLHKLDKIYIFNIPRFHELEITKLMLFYTFDNPFPFELI